MCKNTLTFKRYCVIIFIENMKGVIVMPKKETELVNELRVAEVQKLLDLLQENDFDLVGLCHSNKITYPTLDSEGNERDIVITVSIPKKEFDGQTEIQNYNEDLINKAKAKAEKEKKKAEAIKKKAEG